MNNSELREKIANAADVEWFSNVQETFNFSYCNYIQTFNGVSSIFEFVRQQIEGWSKISSNIPAEISNSLPYFQEIERRIIEFVSNYTQLSGNDLINYWSNVRNQISNIGQRPLPFEAPQTIYLIQLYNENPAYFQGAYSFLLYPNGFNINNRENLSGALLGYEFTMKDKTSILRRVDSEQKSINILKSEFREYLSETEEVVISQLKHIKNVASDNAKKIEKLANEKEKLFSTWFENTKNEEWQKWIDPTKQSISELEQTYRVKLKLEEPAKYWEERAIKLKRQGWISLSVLVGLVALTCWSLGEILWSSPEQIYSSWFQGDKSAAIRWSIVYITLISFIAFCIRAISKVMFSSFHLARDCEERHTLTYFYLALLKDSKVDENDRHLIMQALFSRAETGLLKEDSSPTMPNDSIGKGNIF